MTSRHWEEGLNQLGDTTEDEDEIPVNIIIFYLPGSEIVIKT